MSTPPDFGFGKFVPGFDFLQNLAKGTAPSMPQVPGLSNWVAPTLDPDELDKRIAELKAVQFWLEQNGKALAATIQALEVQKMTLATLRGMNVNMAEMAEAMQARTAEAMDGMQKMAEAASGSAAAGAAGAPAAAPAQPAAQAGTGDAATAAVVDPLQWWGALTQQFQQIAATALQEVAQAAPAAASDAGPAASRKAAAGKSPARKSPARKKPAAGRTPRP